MWKPSEKYIKIPEFLSISKDSINKLLENHSKEGDLVLDVGCGYGKLSKHLSTLGRRVIAIDTNEEVIENRTEILTRLKAAKKVLPIMNALDKAEKAEFKGQKKSALNAVLDALFQCREDNVTNSDFARIDLRGKPDGQLVTVEYLTQKAKDLGWNPPTS